jgi:orotidine-5'-phosphate decarboxylase
LPIILESVKPSDMNFLNRLAAAQKSRNSLVCVGLDPDPDRLPKHLAPTAPLPERILAFNTAIVKATAPFASAFKINFAFYEALGAEGWKVLEATRALIPEEIVAIADCKRGDIGNSARFYAKSVFDTLAFDACTVAPYMGSDSYTPFLEIEGKGAFILARTSNPGAADIQEKMSEGAPIYEWLVRQIASLPESLISRAGLVVGATSPGALKSLRKLAPDLPFLIPGIGAQGGDVEAVMRAAYRRPGTVVINSSRAILYAGEGPDFAEAAAHEAERLRRELQAALPDSLQ